MALRRLFVGVALTDEMRHAIAASFDGLVIPGRVVPPQRWHLTLRFIGEIDQITTERVTAALDQAELGEAFSVGWGALGAFPRPRRATVLWLGVDRGATRLSELAATVEDAVAGAGLGPEERPFRPHLTLSRIRPPQDVEELISAGRDIGSVMPVRSVALFETHWGRGGPRYEAVERFGLS